MANDTFRFHRNIFVIEFGWQEIGKRFSVWFYKTSFKFSLLWHSPFALLWRDKLVISSVLWNFNFSAPFLSQLTQIFNLFASHFFLTGWRWWPFSSYNLFGGEMKTLVQRWQDHKPCALILWSQPCGTGSTKWNHSIMGTLELQSFAAHFL